MKTEELLLSHYGTPLIPLELWVRDYFRHLNVEKYLAKTLRGEIQIAVVRMEGSQKSAKAVHVADAGAYLDRQIEAARRECRQLSGAAS
jgi:Pyocin activator protein PrtN